MEWSVKISFREDLNIAPHAILRIFKVNNLHELNAGTKNLSYPYITFHLNNNIYKNLPNSVLKYDNLNISFSSFVISNEHYSMY